jgi:hypothetical protein
MALRVSTSSGLARFLRCCAFLRRLQVDSSATRLGEAYCDSLLRRASTVLALTDVVHLFTHEFSRLSTRRLSGALIFASPLYRLLFWHVEVSDDAPRNSVAKPVYRDIHMKSVVLPRGRVSEVAYKK